MNIQIDSLTRRQFPNVKFGDYSSLMTLPFSPVPPDTTRGHVVQSLQGLETANNPEKLAEFLRKKVDGVAYNSFAVPGSDLFDEGMLMLQKVRQAVPPDNSVVVNVQGKAIHVIQSGVEGLIDFLLTEIMGKHDQRVPFMISTFENGANIARLVVAPSLSNSLLCTDIDRDDPNTRILQTIAENLLEDLGLEYGAVDFTHGGNGQNIIRPVNVDTSFDPRDLEAIKEILRMHAEQ